MKKLYIIFIFLAAVVFCACNKTIPETVTPAPVPGKAENQPSKGKLSSIPEEEDIDFWSDYPAETLSKALADRMTNEELLAQILMFGWSGTVPGQEVKSWVIDRKLGSIKIFGWNTDNTYALAENIKFFQEETQKTKFKIPLFVATDQEGGWIRHVKGRTTETPGNLAIGATGLPYDAYYSGYYIGMEIRALGINMNFAPTVDLYTDLHSTVIGPRSFGENPREAGLLGLAFAQGQLKAGVIPTAKHYPGHGDTNIDSHGILPVIDADMETLRNRELVPFRILSENKIPAIMTGHLAFPKVTDGKEIPASLSSKFIKTILEDELNFDGLVITDDMMMNGAIATTGSLSESFIEAIKAGNHIILSSTTPLLQDRFWTKSLNLMESDGDFFSTVKNAAIKVLETKLTYLKGENAVPLYPDISSLDEKVPAQGAEDFFLEQAARATTLVKSGNINLNSGKKILIAGGYRAFLSEGTKRFPQAETCYLSQSNSIRENQRILSNAAADFEIVIYCVHSYNSGKTAEILKNTGKELILVSSLAPVFIENLLWAEEIYAVYSYSPSSYRALFAALSGDFIPEGKMPLKALRQEN